MDKIIGILLILLMFLSFRTPNQKTFEINTDTEIKLLLTQFSDTNYVKSILGNNFEKEETNRYLYGVVSCSHMKTISMKYSQSGITVSNSNKDTVYYTKIELRYPSKWKVKGVVPGSSCFASIYSGKGKWATTIDNEFVYITNYSKYYSEEYSDSLMFIYEPYEDSEIVKLLKNKRIVKILLSDNVKYLKRYK